MKESPFKETGELKPNYIAKADGIIYDLNGAGRMLEPATKHDGTNWTINDCNNVVKRLFLRGISIKEMSRKTGYKETTIQSFYRGNKMSGKAVMKFVALENKIK